MGNLLFCTVPVCCLCPSNRTATETCCIVLCLSAVCVPVPGQEGKPDVLYCAGLLSVSQYTMLEWETCCTVSVPVCCMCHMYHDRKGILLYCTVLVCCLSPSTRTGREACCIVLCRSAACVPVPGQEGKPAVLYCACLLSVSQYQDRKGNLLYCTVPVCCLYPSTRTERET
jgi:hypothetical protein